MRRREREGGKEREARAGKEGGMKKVKMRELGGVGSDVREGWERGGLLRYEKEMKGLDGESV